MRRADYLGGGLIVAACFAVSCLVGVRAQRAEDEPVPDAYCPARWAAEDDPTLAEATEAMASVAADLPEGSQSFLPERAVRLSADCPLVLPVRIERGRCYLFATQVLPFYGRPHATLRIPDPSHDEPRERVLDHTMPVTFGQGADPVCFNDTFESFVEISTEARIALMWVQGWETSPAAAQEWASHRRERLEAAAIAAQREREAREAAEAQAAAEDDRLRAACAIWAAGQLPDGGPIPDGGIVDPALCTADGGLRRDDGAQPDAGPDAEPEAEDQFPYDPPEGGWQPCDGGVPDGAIVDGGGPIPCTEPEPEPEPEVVPEPGMEDPTPGPLAIEEPGQCEDGQDNDADGFTDCADTDCVGVCTEHRTARAPWMRIIDFRLGGAYRVAHSGIVAEDPLDSTYDPLAARWGISTQAAAVWRPHRYLGIGLDLGVNFLELRSYLAGDGRSQQNRVRAVGVSLGLSLQLSVPIWIMEIGGTVGLGCLHVQATGEYRELVTGLEDTWNDNPDGNRNFDRLYGAGWLWVDFWLRDFVAVGLYGGLMAPLDETIGVPSNDYHVGVRTTLRLGL